MPRRSKWISFVCSFLFIKPQASPSAPPRKLASSPFVSFSLLYFPFSPLTCAMQCNTQGEEGGFTLERPRSQTNLVTNDAKGRARCPSDRWMKILNRKKGVNCTLELLKYCLQFRSEVSRDGESGGETPSMAGQSNQNLLKIENPQ